MNQQTDSAKICKLLPHWHREALAKAAQVSVRHDPLARVKAIELAVKRAKLSHPELFA